MPIALAVAGVLAFTGPGGFLLRVFFGMWLHELGHALASWCCGVFAVPLPWVTFGGPGRSPAFVVALFGALGALGLRWWLADGTRSSCPRCWRWRCRSA